MSSNLDLMPIAPLSNDNLELRSYVDSELASIRSRIKNIANNIDNIDKQIKAKDAHLVSTAYHMSSVESNTNNLMYDLRGFKKGASWVSLLG